MKKDFGNDFVDNEEIVKDENLSSYDKATYFVLDYYSENRNRNCTISLKHWQKKVGCSRPRLMKSINNLIEANYITKEKRHRKDGGNTTNLYKIIK